VGTKNYVSIHKIFTKIRLGSYTSSCWFRGNNATFSFEFSWLKIEGFYDMFSREWENINFGDSPLEQWQNKIRHLAIIFEVGLEIKVGYIKRKKFYFKS
jgi:hypothetical protein